MHSSTHAVLQWLIDNFVIYIYATLKGYNLLSSSSIIFQQTHVLVTIAVMTHLDQKQSITDRSQGRKSGQELKQGSNLEPKADAEVIKWSCLLPYFPWFAQPAFL